MSRERWQRIEDVCHSALEKKPDQRAAFLSEICGADDELRREVESLLRQGESQEALIDRPAWEAAGELLDTRPNGRGNCRIRMQPLPHGRGSDCAVDSQQLTEPRA